MLRTSYNMTIDTILAKDYIRQQFNRTLPLQVIKYILLMLLIMGTLFVNKSC